MNATTDLLDLLDEAREASPASRIEYRDRIAAHGAAAITAIRSWLSDPALAAFAIRVVERSAALDADARVLAIESLREVRGNRFAESVRQDAEEALKRIGSSLGRSTTRPIGVAPTTSPTLGR